MLLQLVENYNEQRDKDALEGWRQHAATLYKEFKSIRLQTEVQMDQEKPETDPDNEANLRKIRFDFETKYLKVYSLIVVQLENLKKAEQATLNSVPPKSEETPDLTHSRIKLPEVKLPNFDGQLIHWINYRDTFVSMIDSNPSLQPIEKFAYLNSSLAPEAKRHIETIDVTAVNYSVAWDILVQRFDNKKLIVRAYIECLLSIEPMEKESYESLARVIDEFERNLNMIGKLEVDTKGWSVLLAHMVCARLDDSVLRQWEQFHKSKEVPTYPELIKFLRDHLSILQSLPPSKSRSKESTKPDPGRLTKPRFSHAVTISSGSRSCPFCKKPPHSFFLCETFRKLPVQQRFDAVKRNSLCINCLSPDHLVKKCTSSSCRVCGQKHHTMLHQNSTLRFSNSNPPQKLSSLPAPDQPQTQNQITSNVVPTPQTNMSQHQSEPTLPSTSHVSTTLHGNARTLPATVLLQTAVVKVSDSTGHFVWARALLDPASQLSLMTEQLSQKLKLKRVKANQEIGGVGNTTVVSSYIVEARIHSHCTDFFADVSFNVLSGITRELPARALCTEDWNLPTDIVFADPSFYQPGPIDMILGIEVYYELIEEGLTRLGPGQPVLQKTVLGWVVSGKIGSHPAPTLSLTCLCHNLTLDEQLERFWELESCQSTSTLSVEETQCEAHFTATTTRDESGRFVVRLPRRPAVMSTLGSSKEIAIRRYLALERRLTANPSLKESYSKFIEEYRTLGHMAEVDEAECSSSSLPTYFLPHHCVLRPESTTTKLRVVFDASCATDTGVSLNDCLMVGPVVQQDLFSIVLRFRWYRYAMVSDVEKMYRQVLVHPADRPLQMIVWRDSPHEPLRFYQLTTVTYGTSCAPYLATRCLAELAKVGETTYPEAAKVVATDFYMDDLLTGVNDVAAGQQLCSHLQNLLGSAGFCLRKWSSNCPSILENLPKELRDERALFEFNSPTGPIKTLGIQWDIASDRILFTVPDWNKSLVITKRVMVSDAAKLFDPYGLIGPVIVIAKLNLQDVWSMQKNWDEPLAEVLQQIWLDYRASLEELRNLSVPRCVIPVIYVVSRQLHGFCDASEKAYGANIYLRTETSDGKAKTSLLASKSRVAPLGNPKKKKQQKTNLPRLELNGGLLLAHLLVKVIVATNFDGEVFLWTDSEIVLHWLNSLPSRWKTFVANRVSEIQHLTAKAVWNHVPGSENPADIISRGMLPGLLIFSVLWWFGPFWLSLPRRYWPATFRSKEESFKKEDLEERPVSLAAQTVEPNPIFGKFSSYTHLIRTVALLRRFSYNSNPLNQNNRRIGFLRTAELKESMETLVRLVQRETFPDELAALADERSVEPHSKIKNLAPFLSDGIIRVGGRLGHAPVSEGRKHPILLPAKHPFTDLVVRYFHEKMLHAQPQLLIASVRSQFWPLRIRNTARRIVHTCVSCFRCRPTNLEQLMGDLPEERVTPTLPFLSTGVDLCGPFKYRHPELRNKFTICYVAVFVCLTTKAVHVEMVGDLTTGAFLASLRRFVARRGKPRLIECDNAQNFKGALNELVVLREQFNSQQHQHDVVRAAAEDGIEFKFIPPRSPNFGGLWEAAVKSLKTHLRTVLGNSVLTAEQLNTLLTQVESCLNSRPLTPLSNDPQDFEALTPGHFLIHRPLTAIPEPSLEEVPQNRLDRWQVVQEFLRRIWKRWTTDYLSGLQQRTKWTSKKDNIRIGTMVLVKDENRPPLHWHLGRVVHVYSGTDGNVRVVDIRTKNGRFRRAISKICILPIHQPSQPGESDLADDL